MKKIIAIVLVTAGIATAHSNDEVLAAMQKHEQEAKEAKRMYVHAMGYYLKDTVLVTNTKLVIVVEGTWIVPKYSKIHGGGKTIKVKGNDLPVVLYITRTGGK